MASFTPGLQQWAGLGRETTYNTPPANPSLYIPIDSPAYTNNTDTIFDTGMRGAMAVNYGAVPGLRADQVTFKTNFYLDSVFFFLRAILGLPDVLTGASDPYTHKSSLQNAGNNGQPAGTTVYFTSGDKTYEMTGALISELKITLKSTDAATLEVTFIGMPATVIAPLTNTPTTAVLMPSWNTTFALNSVATTLFSELDLDIKRDVKAIQTINGTQAPMAIYGGGVDVTGDITSVFQGSTDPVWMDYTSNSQVPLTAITAPVGDATHSIKLQMSKIKLSKAAWTGTSDYLELKSSFTAIANATDALDSVLSPLQAIGLLPASAAI